LSAEAAGAAHFRDLAINAGEVGFEFEVHRLELADFSGAEARPDAGEREATAGFSSQSEKMAEREGFEPPSPDNTTGSLTVFLCCYE
jgi:hypothetical protein